MAHNEPKRKLRTQPIGWFRLHREILNNRKIMLMPEGTFRAWVMMMCAADDETGMLPDSQAIAWLVRMSPTDVNRYLDDLIDRALIDIMPNGDLVIHGWTEHQYKKSDHNGAERVRKHRARKSKLSTAKRSRNVTCNDFPSGSGSGSASEEHNNLTVSRGSSQGEDGGYSGADSRGYVGRDDAQGGDA